MLFKINLISTTLCVLAAGWLTFKTLHDAGVVQEGAREALEHQRDEADSLSKIREKQVEDPDSDDYDTQQRIDALLDETETMVAECNRMAEKLLARGRVSLALSFVFTGYKEVDAFNTAEQRLIERLRDLSSLRSEALDEHAARTRSCYCSCAGSDGSAKARGKSTAGECTELCRASGYAKAICM